MNCPKCNAECNDEWKSCPKCGTILSKKFLQKREYQTAGLPLSKGAFRGSIGADDIQNKLTEYAQNGWVFDSQFSNEFFLFLIFHRELV